MELQLKGHVPGMDAVVDWDPDTGTFTGRDAVMVEAIVAEAEQRQRVCSHPWPTEYDCVDPRHIPADLALALSPLWDLPEELADLLPAWEAGDPDLLY